MSTDEAEDVDVGLGVVLISAGPPLAGADCGSIEMYAEVRSQQETKPMKICITNVLDLT